MGMGLPARMAAHLVWSYEHPLPSSAFVSDRKHKMKKQCPDLAIHDNSEPIIDEWIDSLDSDRQAIAYQRLHFLKFISSKQPYPQCQCGEPTLVVEPGPGDDERRRIECGVCHKFYWWLPKLKNKDRRPGASIGLADSDFCQCCRRSGVRLVGHHVIEVAEGGTDDPINIWTVCDPCHTIIHAMRKAVKSIT